MKSAHWTMDSSYAIKREKKGKEKQVNAPLHIDCSRTRHRPLNNSKRRLFFDEAFLFFRHLMDAILYQVPLFNLMAISFQMPSVLEFKQLIREVELLQAYHFSDREEKFNENKKR